MKRALLIALAGGIGSLARYLVGSNVQRLTGPAFPWGTFAVNIIGCLLFGYFWGLETFRNAISSETRAIILVGFMGGFTTFSSFAFESYSLLRDGSYGMAAVNMLSQNVLGIVSVWGGIALARGGAA